MKNYEFICWLEGYLDLCPDDEITPKKLRIIRNHLNLVVAVEGKLGEINQLIMSEVTRLLDNSSPNEDLNLFKVFAREQVEMVFQHLTPVE